jgi:hypothetical protein
LFKPESIKKKAEEIKERNNLTSLSQRDMLIYAVHRIDEIVGCVNSNEVAIVQNRTDIGWLKKNYWRISIATFSAIGLLALYLIFGVY